MSHPVFLIDLASARPSVPPPQRQWPAIAKEHSNHLTKCVQRILAHTDVKLVTTHIFDSSTLMHSDKPSTTSLKYALQGLKRLPDIVACLNITRSKHPSANGLMAGFADAIVEDSFSEFYQESGGDTQPSRDVYLFARAPTTIDALRAFVGGEESDLAVLKDRLDRLQTLKTKMKALVKRGERLVWVNSTPRRCERVDDVDQDVENVFTKWLHSYSKDFRFVNLHSFLLDRRIIPAKSVVTSLSDGCTGDDRVLGQVVDVLFLQDSELLRCFSTRMNLLDDSVMAPTSKASLVLSGLVRRYRTEELVRFGAFDTPARLITPASTPAHGERPSFSSIFAGMMVDLARQNMCLIADMFEVDEADGSFSRFQALLQPLTPLSAVLRKVSLKDALLVYDDYALPQTFDEWMSWTQLQHVKDCDVADSAINASAKFFETYLPALFAPATKYSTTVKGAGTGKSAQRKTVTLRDDNMLLSFEDGSTFVRDSGHQALDAFVKTMNKAQKPSSSDHCKGAKVPDRESIMKQLQSQHESEQRKEEYSSPKLSRSRKVSSPDHFFVQKTPIRQAATKQVPLQKFAQHGKQMRTSPKSAIRFRWERGSKVVAPKNTDIQACIDDHAHDVNVEQTAVAKCKNSERRVENATSTQRSLARSEAIIKAGISPTTPDEIEADVAIHSFSPVITPGADASDPGSIEVGTSSEHRSCPIAPKMSIGTGKEQAVATIGDQGLEDQLEISMAEKRTRQADASMHSTVLSAKRARISKLPVIDQRKEDLAQTDQAGVVQRATGAFCACVNELRNESSRPVARIVWDCVEHLSSLAKALASGDELHSDVDRVVNLSLKIPRAVGDAVQNVHNSIKREDVSTTTLFREMWETILLAFEQAVWHLARSRGKVAKKPNRKRIHGRINSISSILSCTQVVAENVANSRQQPVSFRDVFSKLFSSALVHFGLCRHSADLSAEVHSLFKEFEKPIPPPLELLCKQKESNTDSKKIQPQSHPHIENGSNAYRKQPEQVGSSREAIATRIPPRDKLRTKITKTKIRVTKLEPSVTIANARKSRTSNIGLERSQFAKESEALRNAIRAPTRLPLQSTRSLKKTKRQLKEALLKKKTNAPVGSTLQDILASTVPAPVTDLVDLGNPDISVSQTPPLSPAQPKEDDAEGETYDLRGVKGCVSKGVGSREDKVGPSSQQHGKNTGQQADRQVSTSRTRSTELRTENEALETEGIGKSSKPDFLSSTSAGRMSRREEKEKMATETCNDKRPSSDCIKPSPGRSRQISGHQAKQDNGERSLEKHYTSNQAESSPASRRVTRRFRKELLAKKSNEEPTPKERSPGAARPITRSQKRQTRQLILQTPPSRKAFSPASSGRKSRRRKDVSADTTSHDNILNTDSVKRLTESTSPITRSQAKEMKQTSSLQLRSGSMKHPRRKRAVVKAAMREVVADLHTQPTKLPMGEPNTPNNRSPTPAADVLDPETPEAGMGDVVSPETPHAVASRHQNSALNRIIISSLEKRKGQLTDEEFVPETPVIPKRAVIIPPGGRSVRRALTYDQ